MLLQFNFGREDHVPQNFSLHTCYVEWCTNLPKVGFDLRFNGTMLRRSVLIVYAGFVGVYMVGYMVEVSQSWSLVFYLTALLNVLGCISFLTFGRGHPIVS